MANNSIDGFFQELSKSPELQKQYAEVFLHTERQIAESLAKLSEQTSSPFTAEEYLAPAVQTSSTEISDAELAEVSGGVWGAVGGALTGLVTALASSGKIRALSNGTIRALDYFKDVAPALVSIGGGLGHAGEKVVDKIRS